MDPESQYSIDAVKETAAEARKVINEINQTSFNTEVALLWNKGDAYFTLRVTSYRKRYPAATTDVQISFFRITQMRSHRGNVILRYLEGELQKHAKHAFDQAVSYVEAKDGAAKQD